MTHEVSLVCTLCLIYSGVTVLVTALTNIYLQVIIPIGRAISLVHNYVIIVSNFDESKGAWFHSVGHTNYMPVIYIMRPKSRCLCLLNCFKVKWITMKPA